MEYSKLEVYAKRMLELSAGKHEFGPKRLAAEKDRLVYDMHRLLRASINKMVGSKSIRNFPQEVQQHSMIAIHQALADWNPSIATFSTHVHWRIRAELATLNHAMFPERRKVKVKQPIQILELDRPFYREDDEADSFLDMMRDETAEDDVEAEARVHMALHALERVLSHYVAQQISSCSNHADLGKTADRRLNFMRDRDIYVRRHLGLQTFDEIAKDIGVTRERVRQIIVKINKDLRHALPHLDKKVVVEATRPTPTDIHPEWPLYAAEYHARTGIDPRLIGRDTPLPAWVCEDAAPAGAKVVIEHIETQGILVAPTDEYVDRIEAEPAPTEQMDLALDPEIRIAKIAVLRHVVHVGAAAAFATMALPAAAQTSRALPPDAGPVVIDGQSISAAVQPYAVRHTAQRVDAHRDRGTHEGPLEPNGRIVTSRPSWGVRVAEYPSFDAAKAGWSAERRSWNWIHGLYPAYFAPDAKIATHGVAFGPLTREQAYGLCHEAKRVSKPCHVVVFGSVKAETGPRVATSSAHTSGTAPAA